MALHQGKRPQGRFDGPIVRPIYFPGLMAGRPNPGDPWGGMSTGLTISLYLLSGVAVWGGVGFLIDRLLGTPKIFTALGMVIGAAAAIYLVYLRYGREHDEKR